MRSNGADPHRVLGIARDATEEEVKRAYRALAKRHHPDAGPGSVARFLEIQAAYESLIGGAGGSSARRAASGRWSSPQAGRRPAQPGGRATGDAGAGGQAAPGASWARRPPGGRARRPGPAPEPDPTAWPRGATREGPEGPPGGPRAEAGSATGGRRAHGRRRATLGSTSYDDVEEVFEPGWSGAAWYGPSSGTYWTLNPKEYADPRKHGPEYLARARRRIRTKPSDGGAASDGVDRPDSTTAGDGSGSPAPGAAGPRMRGAEPDDLAPGARDGGPGPRDGGPGPRAHEPGPGDPEPSRGPSPGGGGGGAASPRPGADVPPSWRVGAWTAVAPGLRVGEPPFHHEPAEAGGPGRDPVAPAHTPDAGPGALSRVILALAGWAVPGLALAAAAGLPGGVAATLPLQAAGVAVLILAPRAAWAAAGGGLALVFAAVPIVAVVAALGGSFVPGGPAPAPALVLAAVAWAAGFAVFAAGRRVPYPWRGHA